MNYQNDSHRPLVNEDDRRRRYYKHLSRSGESLVLDIYPLTNYYFGCKDALPFREETVADRLNRMKLNYDTRGLRTCVQAVMLVGLSKHPHLLLLQTRNTIYNLPGGRSRPGESDTECLRRKLSSKLSDGTFADWEVGECIGMWWRHSFEGLLSPYLPPHIKHPKERTKLFLVKPPESQRFTVAKNHKILAVPLCEIHENQKTYGPIISGVPQLLSKFSLKAVEG